MGSTKYICIGRLLAFLSLGFYFPMFFPDFFLRDHFPNAYYPFFRALLLILPLGATYFCFQNETGHFLGRGIRAGLLAATALFLEYLHHRNVDLAFHYYFFFPRQNMIWQHQIHSSILALNPWELPHSYRFLPNALVAWIDLFASDFQYSKEIYRCSTMILLVYAIFYFAGLYFRKLGAWLCVLCYAALYPISIRYYNGQLIDPASHLSFVCSFIFIRQKKVARFALTIFHGVFAKESVLIMAIFNMYFRRKERRALCQGTAILLLGLAAVLFVRYFANSWKMGYSQISGTSPDWYLGNLHSNDWVAQNLICLGMFLPFFALRFNRTEPFLRELILFLAPALFLSNFLFSWLYEARNYIPATIPLIIVTLLFWGDVAEFLIRKIRSFSTAKN